MDGTVAAIISGTVLLIALFLILSRNSGSGQNAFSQVVGSVGAQYTSVVKALMGTS